MNLGRRELALLCVLMLRGPQTVGELRGRTERMHDFTDLDEVEGCLEALAAREPEPLTARASRGRWVHLLGGVPAESAEPVLAAAGRTALEERVATLEREVEQLKEQFERFRQQFE